MKWFKSGLKVMGYTTHVSLLNPKIVADSLVHTIRECFVKRNICTGNTCKFSNLNVFILI